MTTSWLFFEIIRDSKTDFRYESTSFLCWELNTRDFTTDKPTKYHITEGAD